MSDTEQQPRGIDALKVHVSRNKLDCGLWISRVITIVFAIGYVLPLFG